MFYGQKPVGHCVEKPAELFLKIFFFFPFSLKEYYAVFKQPQLFFILRILMIITLASQVNYPVSLKLSPKMLFYFCSVWYFTSDSPPRLLWINKIL